MKTNKYLFLPIIFLITSCYIYKPYTEKDIDEKASKHRVNAQPISLLDSVDKPVASVSKQKIEKEKQNISGSDSKVREKKENGKQIEEVEQKEEKKQEQTEKNNFSNVGGSINVESKSNKSPKAEEPLVTEKGIKGKLQPNKYFKITALGNQYKIQVDKWEGDTLVSHKIRQPKKQYKFHMNDIEEETILERRFSKPISDVLTVGAYVAGGAAVLLLVL